MHPFVQSIAQQLLSVGKIISETSLSPEVKEYVAAAIAPATRRAYQGDLKDFFSWGGCVPCTPSALAEYIANRAQTHSPFTIAR